MNPNLDLLHPYPFQKLRDLFKGTTANPAYKPINMSIGEPKHPTPAFIRESLVAALDGLANYPTTQGLPELRSAIGQWLERRYGLPAIDVERQILPVNGSREALFAFAQAVVDTSGAKPVVISPNPFYQIYEGAALLAGAEPYFLNTLPENGYRMDFGEIPADVLERAQLVYVCSPGNPTGRVLSLDEWRNLFDLSDRYGFIIAADECYSEIYFDADQAPLGALEAAHRLGRSDFKRIVMFNSLSKRSNVPGMRSGIVAGDAAILEKFLLYRTYHGCAMSPAVQAASAAAWRDEAHVVENRRLYREKFAAVTPVLETVLPVALPDAGFYHWVRTPVSDTEFALGLYRDYNVTVLPGSYLARPARNCNPGENFIRIALVAGSEECLDAAQRILEFTKKSI
ncbi:MAG: succinyldiaminopimelate transaminase [Sulfuricellaceae bacterium]|nr:succinyldiaminopimelate transaminase [Sulfuricellaceae bacterium]